MSVRDFLRELLATDLVLSRRAHPELAHLLDHHRRRGELTAVLPGVFAATGTERSAEARLRALMLWDPDAVVTGWAAARATFWPGPEVGVLSAAVKHHRAVRAGFAFCRRVIPLDLIMQRGRVRLTVPALTALDLCAETNGDSIDQVLRTGAATIHELRAVLAATSKRRGNNDRRRLLLDSRAEPWSAAERRVHGLLREANITGWQANVETWLGTQQYFIDIAFPTMKLAVEIDGLEFHGAKQFEKDRSRQNALVLDGWTVLRFTWAMIVDDPEKVIREIRAALAACAVRRRL